MAHVQYMYMNDPLQNNSLKMIFAFSQTLLIMLARCLDPILPEFAPTILVMKIWIRFWILKKIQVQNMD